MTEKTTTGRLRILDESVIKDTSRVLADFVINQSASSDDVSLGWYEPINNNISLITGQRVRVTTTRPLRTPGKVYREMGEQRQRVAVAHVLDRRDNVEALEELSRRLKKLGMENLALRLQNSEYEEENLILHEVVTENLTHKRLAKYSFLFVLFFLSSFLSNLVLGVMIVQPFWNIIGIVFSFGFLIMSWAMSRDWEDTIK